MKAGVCFSCCLAAARPFTVKSGFQLIPDSDVLEYVCLENEKDRVHVGN
jgi:hypothetical protein